MKITNASNVLKELWKQEDSVTNIAHQVLNLLMEFAIAIMEFFIKIDAFQVVHMVMLISTEDVLIAINLALIVKKIFIDVPTAMKD